MGQANNDNYNSGKTSQFHDGGISQVRQSRGQIDVGAVSVRNDNSCGASRRGREAIEIPLMVVAR